MKMDTETKIVIAFLKSAIEQTPFHIEEEHIDWEKTEKILSFHRVANMAYYGYLQLENKDCVPPQLVQKLERAYQKAVVKEAHQHFALEEIRETFEKNGIDFVPLKGCVLKYLYPAPQMRVMGDLDVLYKEEQQEAVARCLGGLGYSEEKDTDVHDVYRRAPYLCVEMHRQLVSKPEKRKEYFDRIWERANPANGKTHEYEMTLEDYYLFFLAHMAAHFLCKGTGLRSLTDFHVFNQNKGNEINRRVVADLLNQIGLSQFEAFLFDMDACIFMGKECGESLLQQAFEYMVDSGIYGTAKHQNVNMISGEKGSEKHPILGKVQYLIKVVFLKREEMEKIYPFLQEHRYLLAPAWIYRLFQKVLFQRQKIAKRWSYVQTDDDELYRMQQIQKRAGL